MLRVLQVVNTMDRAGLETMLMNYYRNMDHSRIQFDFLTHRNTDGAYDEEIISFGGRVYHAPRLYPQNYIAYFKFMKSFFKEHPEYTIIHSHIDTMSAFPLYAAKRSQVPIRIAHSHSSRLDKDAKLLIKYLAKLAVPKVANIYCACGLCAGNFLYGEKQFKVLNNAIDLKEFEFNPDTRKRKRAELGIENELVIGHVGRYYYVKNQLFLINVFSQLLKKVPNSKLLLIGKGQDEARLRHRVKELNLDNNVQFMIDRSDVKDLYQAMDALVMPSLFEGLPVVAVEAQANGLPCIVSSNISSEVLLSDNIQKLSLESGVDGWVKAILKLETRRNTNAIYQLREQGYDVDVEAEKLEKWYYSLCK